MNNVDYYVHIKLNYNNETLSDLLIKWHAQNRVIFCYSNN
jgi:hypothetical protein